MTRFTLVVLATMLSTSSLAGQGSLVGVWKVSYPAGARVENGEQTAIMGTGTLRIEQRGDSLIGELVSDPVADLPTRAPTRMAGPAGAGPVSLIARTTGTVDINGEARPVTAVSTWRLEAKGDSVVGTLSHRVEGLVGMAQDPGPVRGARQGS